MVDGGSPKPVRTGGPGPNQSVLVDQVQTSPILVDQTRAILVDQTRAILVDYNRAILVDHNGAVLVDHGPLSPAAEPVQLDQWFIKFRESWPISLTARV